MLKRCKQRALAEDLTLKQFVIQTLENALAEMIGSQELKTAKGQFDSVLSQMLRTPPKKEADMKVGKNKAEAKQPKPSRQQSDR